MRRSVEELLAHFQVRNKKSQKADFVNWLESRFEEENYVFTKNAYSKSGTNFIVGDVEKADIILTAHYDTPPHMIWPIVISGMGIISYTVSQFIIIAPMLIFYWAILFINSRIPSATSTELAVFMVVLVAIMSVLVLYTVQLLCSIIPNKRNANDNTSGIAVLISLMEDLPLELREKVCFVFFDEEEKGLVGAFAFKKKYKKIMKNKALINFDCVANGEHFLLVGKKAFRESPYQELLKQSVKEATLIHKKIHFKKASTTIYPSDQLVFKNSLGVVAVKKAPVFGYYLSDIHTGRDKVFQNENIEQLNRMMLDFLQRMSISNI